MMKKVRRVVGMESSSPSSSSLPSVVGHQQQEARARFKHQVLLQDFEEVLMETEEKKRLLQATMEKRLRLTAEVRFLREKFRSFLRNPSQTIPQKAMKQKKKRPLQKMASPLTQFAQSQNPVNPKNNCDVLLKDMDKGSKDANVPCTSALFDLNQVSDPNADEMEGIQVEWEPLKVDKSKRCSVDGEVLGNNDLNLPFFRDVVNGSSHVSKRKISWQDQVALRV